MEFYICNIQTDFSDWRLRHFLWNCPNMNVTGLRWWPVNIGSGNGLLPSGNEPLPETMLTQICRHMASLGHNELREVEFRSVQDICAFFARRVLCFCLESCCENRIHWEKMLHVTFSFSLSDFANNDLNDKLLAQCMICTKCCCALLYGGHITSHRF